jgi:hypothetical protein
MSKANEPPVAYLRECFDCDFKTGVLRWRTRPREHFASARAWKVWNKLYPGRLAGTPKGRGYLSVALVVDGKERRLHVHRVVFALAHGRWPVNQIDHRRGVKAGNGIANLQEATHAENSQNLSKVAGVTWSRQHRKWKAQVRAFGRNYHLGEFNNPEDARCAYLAGKRILHPFRPVLRGVDLPEIRSWVSTAALRIIKAARKHGNKDLELEAWQALVDA